LVCFVTSWLVLLLGEEVRWTPWGIVSGLFWVPGAACGIYGIRNAGVAVAVGTWSSIQVVSSCIFGIIIFKESVKDVPQTMMAFLVLMTGLVGMSVYSETPANVKTQSSSSGANYQPVATGEESDAAVPTATIPMRMMSPPSPVSRKLQRKNSKSGSMNMENASEFVAPPTLVEDINKSSMMVPMELEDGNTTGTEASDPLIVDDKNRSMDRVVLFGGRLNLTKRQMGMLGAIVNGIWGGLNLIPLHYAQRDQGMSGASYLISYATGSLIVCISIWILLFTYHYVNRGYSVKDAIDALPPFHVRELGLPGLCAGLFYSIGNFCSILAVSFLGQGVGFSFCQGQLLISGLWGVFYFGEIQGQETIIKWFSSAGITIIGIIWLSYQHEGGSVHRYLQPL
jgi:glucose uptake protein GlcU